MTEPQKAERDAFEKYWSARGWLFNGQIVYEDGDTKNAWAIWQAAFEAGRSARESKRQLNYEIDGETKWLIRDGMRFVSTGATECEMELWAALKEAPDAR